MTDREMLEYVMGCLKEIRESQRSWGEINITVEAGNVKFVNLKKTPKYKLEDGQMIDISRNIS